MRNFLGTSQTVTNTEKWIAAIAAGQAFSFGAGVGASVGNFSFLQLKNPAASGKTAIVRAFFPSVGAAASISLSLYDTDLTSDAGTGFNLLSGGAVSACHVRFQQSNAALGNSLMQLQLAASVVFTPALEWFAQLAQGQGIIVYCQTLNTAITNAFLWMEQ